MAEELADTLQLQLEAAVVGRFDVARLLGRGGMGAVFLARDAALDRQVAVKVLPPEFAQQTGVRERFLRETRIAASFSHPHIVPVHTVEAHGPLLFFVMGYVEGDTLAQRIARVGPLSTRELTRLVQEVAWALAYAHGRGVVHRDVKPDNILIERATGRALVMDFGIARTSSPTTLTTVGAVIGTPEYMSPEQAAGETVDGRSDLYSLGVVAFQAATGRLPFTAGSTTALLAMHLTREPPAVASLRPDLPAPLAAAVDRCLAKEPAERFASGDALVDALESVRIAQPEVPAAVRYFQLRADGALRTALVVALLAPLVIGGAQGDADRLALWSVVVVILVSLAFQVVRGMRGLTAQGFTFHDLRTGLEAVAAERAAAHELFEVARRTASAQPGGRVAHAVAGLTSIGLIAGSLAQRQRMSWGYRIGRVGMVMMVAGVLVGGLLLLSVLMRPGRATVLERVALALWMGRPGRALFALGRVMVVPRAATRAERAAATAPAASPMPVAAPSGPSSPTAALADARHGHLGDARDVLSALEGRALSLRARDTTLAEVESEAQRVTLPPVMAAADAPLSPFVAERNALLLDLADARRRVAAEHLSVATTTARLRLQLLRARSGLAGPEVVQDEVDAARAILMCGDAIPARDHPKAPDVE